MINYLIFEDEPAALQRLERLISNLRPDYRLVGSADTVEDAVQLIDHQEYDLIFSDVQLSDGLCFEIFEKMEINKPIIFVTAYDEYAIKAFKYNGLHYILKPIQTDLLLEAILKFEKNKVAVPDFSKINFTNISTSKEIPKRLISKIGSKHKVIEISRIALFFTDNSVTSALSFEGKTQAIDYNLDTIMNQLSDDIFFRINRQMIININAVSDMISYSSNRYKLLLSVPFQEEIIVSKEKSTIFKSWIASH